MDQETRNQAAFEATLESRLRDIHSYFRRLGVDATAAEDLTQETFVAAWRDLAGLRDETKLGGWLYRIAYHCFLRHKRRAAVNVTVELAQNVAGESSGDPGSDERLDARIAAEALEALPGKYLHPLTLVYWQNLSYREAAKVLSLPIGTLAWRVHKALRLIRQALAEKGAEDASASPKPQTCRAADPLDES